MGIFGGLFKALMGEFSGVFGTGMVEELDDAAIAEMFDSRLAELSGMVSELTPFADKADESYMSLIYNRLEKVPAVE